jgi:SAM-dependent methyltransferase
MPLPLQDAATCLVCGSEGQKRGRKDGFDLYRCPDCSLLFVFPLPAAPLEIYSQDYFEGSRQGHGYADYDRDKEATIPAFRKYLDLIESASGRKGNLLDIGAATGFFLNLARQRGWETTGIEPSHHAAAIGRAKGLDVQTGTVETLASPDKAFDVVTMWDVIEHVSDPAQVLAKVHSLLKPGGVVATNTPDSGSWWARCLGMNWYHIGPPEHLNLFSIRSLHRLFNDCGFDCVLTTKIGKTFTLRYIFQILANRQKWRLWNFMSEQLTNSALGQLGIPINFRDSVFLIGRRRV